MNEIPLNNHSSVVKLVKPVDVAPKVEEASKQATPALAEVKQISEPKQVVATAKADNEKADDTKSKEKPENLKEAVTRLNDFVQSTQRDLQFKLDENSGRTVITVLDRKTQEVIRQIPDDEALKLAQSLHQDEPLTLFTAKV